MAKIRRNGTFNTGMKNRISAPIEVLNALASPTVSLVTLGWKGNGLRSVFGSRRLPCNTPPTVCLMTGSVQAKS